MHQPTDKDTMDHQFIITYHPNKQHLPARTLQLIFNGPIVNETEVIHTLLQSVQTFLPKLNKIAKEKKTPENTIPKQLEAPKDLPDIKYKPKKLISESPIVNSYWDDYYGH